MKSDADNYILLWGGPVSPSSAKRVLYWAVNEKGRLCGVVLPADVWSAVEKKLESPAGLQSPYLSVAVFGLSTPHPELRLITMDADTLYDFCFIKNSIYRLKRPPQKLNVDIGSLISHMGMADTPALATLKRFGSHPDKGEFFTSLPDKSRVELYYMIEENETPPPKLGVQVLWAIKGYGLPVAPKGTGHRPDEGEKAVLNRSAVKPMPFWLRQIGKMFKRRRS